MVNFNKPLFWHQGLFLQPQHFQYESLHAQHHIMQHMSHSTTYPWGIAQLQIDELMLNSGVVEFKALEVLFDDGALVSFPDNTHIKSRNIEGFWNDRNKPLNVYIGINKLSVTEGNVTVVTSFDNAPEIPTRYVSLAEGESYHDLHQGDVSTSLRTLKYAVGIYFENEIEHLSDQIFMPIAQIEQQGDDVRYSTDFIPPSISLKASSVLLGHVKDIRDELLGRSKQLDTYKSTSTSRAAEFNPVAERYRSALRTIARYAPLLKHYYENSVVPPVEVYGQLSSLVGELSTFSNRMNILGEANDGGVSLARYQHQSLGECFNNVKQVIIALLDELTVSPELLVRFERSEDGRFMCDLTPEFFAKQHSMYLLLETSTHFGELVTSFNTFSKLGAENVVDTYVHRAIPGISVNQLAEQPTGLERRSKVSYFTVDRDSDKWKIVEEQGKIALQWDDAPEDLVVEMVVVRG